MERIPTELSRLVHHAVDSLGRAIREEMGEATFGLVEDTRVRFKNLRGKSPEEVSRSLGEHSAAMEALSGEQRYQVAHSFTVMLELMNCCENAFRTHRLRRKDRSPAPVGADTLTYVLTAHPTEARSLECIILFRRIQSRILEALERGYHRLEYSLIPLLKIALKIPTAKQEPPSVDDEATNIFSFALSEESLAMLAQAHIEGAHVFLRTWVGGDKDGHPGVSREQLRGSLTRSRGNICDFILTRLDRMMSNLGILSAEASEVREEARELRMTLPGVVDKLAAIRELGPGDGGRVGEFCEDLNRFRKGYETLVGASTLTSTEVAKTLAMFPALVVPLELRENVRVFREGAEGKAIHGMLEELKSLSEGGDPDAYARGLIISMAETAGDMELAGKLMASVFGGLPLPVVPLFEKESALRAAEDIIREFCANPLFRKALDGPWNKRIEVMLGYSDSAKEIGGLPSRLLIAEAMGRIDALCKEEGIIPVFFQGSGGSVERGGGSVAEQTAWWPSSALRRYKVTVQGEMVQRSFSSPEILESQLRKVAVISSEAVRNERGVPEVSPVLERFAGKVQGCYQETLRSGDFLEILDRATLYPFLQDLRLGSRPAKRKGSFSLDNVRAIPWVLCWTQSRVLFPSWWGVGTAWGSLTSSERDELRGVYSRDKLLSSFIKLLGFTLAKVELGVWWHHLARSGLPPERVEQIRNRFEREFNEAMACVRDISGQDDLLWFRPWLGESIRLRTVMIHPLNTLQLIARDTGDLKLLRETVSGVAIGMLTTG